MKSVKAGGVTQMRYNAPKSGSSGGSEKKQIVKGRAAVDASCPISDGSHILEEGNDMCVRTSSHHTTGLAHAYCALRRLHCRSYDVYLNQCDIAANRNKFYIIQLLESDDGTKQYHTWCAPPAAPCL